MFTGIVVCPLHSLTGLDCPLCGATRATLSLLHGHVGRAFDHNAVYVGLLPFIAIGLVAVALRKTEQLRRLAPPCAWLYDRRAGAMIIVLSVFFVVRNLPFPGVRWLAAS